MQTRLKGLRTKSVAVETNRIKHGTTRRMKITRKR